MQKEENSLDKSSVEIVREGLGHAVGLDRGFFITSRDIFKNPKQVIDSFYRNENRYLHPFAFLVTTGGIYLLVANLFVDWGLFSDFSLWLFRLGPNPPSPDKLEKVRALTADLLTQFFSKYYVAFMVAMTFLRAAFFINIGRGASYARMLVIFAYRHGGGLLVNTAFLLPLLIHDSRVYIAYLAGMIVVEQWIFRKYISQLLGDVSRKKFTKRVWIVLLICIGIMSLGYFLEKLGL